VTPALAGRFALTPLAVTCSIGLVNNCCCEGRREFAYHLNQTARVELTRLGVECIDK
jgi:hypothetical protein